MTGPVHDREADGLGAGDAGELAQQAPLEGPTTAPEAQATEVPPTEPDTPSAEVPPTPPAVLPAEMSLAVGDQAAGPAVAAALAEIATLQGQPVGQHVDVYERAHRSLQDAMADADEA